MKLDCRHNTVLESYIEDWIILGNASVQINKIHVCRHCLAVQYRGFYIGKDDKPYPLPERWRQSGLPQLLLEVGKL